jgi:hypothetical protein
MSWQFIVVLVLAIPVLLFAPVMIWAAVASGLFQVVRDRVRRRFAS